MYENVDLTDFKPPCILSYQAQVGTPMKLYPFDPKNIVYSDKKAGPAGSYVVNMDYHLVCEDEKIDCVVPIILQTPVMKSPFGVSKSKFENKDKSGKTSDAYSLSLSMGGIDSNEEIRDFFYTMCAWDARNLEVAQQRKAQWFSGHSKIKDEQVEFFQKRLSMIRVAAATSTSYPPRIDSKIEMKYGLIQTKFYDANQNPIEHTFITTGALIRAVLKCNGLWLTPSGFSVTFGAKQVQLSPSVNFDEYSFAGSISNNNDSSPVIDEDGYMTNA